LKQNLRQGIIVSGEAVTVIQQALKLRVGGVAENLKEAALGLTELHDSRLAPALMRIIGDGLVQQAPNPSLQHERIRIKSVLLLVTK
jgi:hypothetical protein